MIFFKKNIFFLIFFINFYSIFDIKRSFFEKNKKNFLAVFGTGIFYLYAKNFYEKKFSKSTVYFNKILKKLEYKKNNNNNDLENDFENFKFDLYKRLEESDLKENFNNEVKIFYKKNITYKDVSKNNIEEKNINILYDEVFNFLNFHKKKENKENLFKKNENSDDDIKIKNFILRNLLNKIFNLDNKKESDFYDLANFLIRVFEIKNDTLKKENYVISFLKRYWSGIFGVYDFLMGN